MAKVRSLKPVDRLWRIASVLPAAGVLYLLFAGLVSSEPTAASADPETVAAHSEVMRLYCVRCHNDKMLRGNLTLQEFDVAHPNADAETAEKVIRKLLVGMMPPPGARRPEGDELEQLRGYLSSTIDQAAADEPQPGRRTFQRLNRAEYRRSIKALLDLEIDAAAFLPPDTVSHGFDNIADVQTLSATLMEGYLRAAGEISRRALGDPGASPSETTYKVPRTASQRHHVEGAPLGTRGGVAVRHTFPADGEYIFKIQLHSTPTGSLFGATAEGEQIEVSIDGHRVALLDVDPLMSEADPNGMNMATGRIPISAGEHRVAAAFVEQFSGPIDDTIAPIEHTLADTQIGLAVGITTLPHLRDLAISGPYNVTGVSASPSRDRIFSCRPTSAEDEISCAEEILARLAREAYRRPLTPDDIGGLMSFYELGATEGVASRFEAGIGLALRAMLASPHFVFRLEKAPKVTGQTAAELDAVDLASRLSFFLWATGPDDELLEAAAAGKLASAEGLDAQVERMLQDPRSEALATRFASQWLRLQDLDLIHPDALTYPQFDKTLAETMRSETQAFFASVVREDRPVPTLLDADYTFVNERLASHYGVPNVRGQELQRVPVADENRRGLLGQASILTLTSHANRTSPVLRGKWVMEVLLGSPPPPPPPDVPDLEATPAVAEARVLTVRERMEVHRSNPSCNSCHRVIDPIGLALENFDVTGAWRRRDADAPLDTSGELYDGTPLETPSDLREALLRQQEAFLTTFAENLLAYALGRRVEYHDMPAVRTITQGAANEGNRLSSFVKGVVMSDAFRMTSVENNDVSSAAAGQ